MAIKSLSKARLDLEQGGDNTMLPIMSLMMILIPILVGNIAFFQMRTFEVSTPGTIVPVENDKPVPLKKPGRAVMLQIKMSKKYNTMQLIDEASGRTLISKVYSHKESDLEEMKMGVIHARQRYQKLDTVLISVENDIPYQNLVEVLSRTNGQPDVSKILSSKNVGREVQNIPKPLKLVLLPRGGL